MIAKLILPPEYEKKQLYPSLIKNKLYDERLWTYLVAKYYGRNAEELAQRLCGVVEKLPDNTSIWLEARAFPSRMYEGNSQIDLAIGHLQKRMGTKHGVQPKGGDWICFAESKWRSDIDCRTTGEESRNQLCRIMENGLMACDDRGIYPQRVYVTLITPKCFKEHPKTRLFGYKYLDYYGNKDFLQKDIELCRFLLRRGDKEILTSRVNALSLNWVTFEDLFDLSKPLLEFNTGKRGCTISSWEKVLELLGDTDLFNDIKK